MAKSQRGGWRDLFGGILRLVRFCEEHYEAIAFDLLTRTNYQIDDIGGALSWSSLDAFIKRLGADSELARDLGKYSAWVTPLQTNVILADLFDLIQVFREENVFYHTKKKIKNKPYPRPGKDNKENKQRIGSGSMPANELCEWINKRRGVNG